MSLKKSISFTFTAQIINTIIGFFTSVIITRILGAEGRGEYAIYINSIAFAVLFFGFSINSTIPYFINAGRVKADELLTTLILFIGLSTLLVYTSLYVLQHYGALGVALPKSIQSFHFRLIFTGIYFITLLTSVLTTYLLAYNKFKEVSIYSVFLQALPAVIYLLMFTNLIPYNHNNPFESVAIVMAIVALLTVIVVIFVFNTVLPVKLINKTISRHLIKQFILFSALAYLGNLATFFNYKLDFWVIDFYWGKSQLGIYSLGAQLSQLLWILPTSIASVLYTYASNCSEAEAVNYAIKLKQIAFYGTLIFAAVGMLLAYYFIPILYGQEFIKTFELMKIFMFGIIPFSIPTVLASLFAARGNFKISFVISLVILLFATAMYFTFIPKWGLKGGALASAITYITASLSCELWFCRIYKVPFYNLFVFDQNFFSVKKIKSYFKQ